MNTPAATTEETPMPTLPPNYSKYAQHVDAACERIAPAWPLDRLIAVNPYWGLVHAPVQECAAKLSALSGTALTMPRAWYRDHLLAGRVRDTHLCEALMRAPTELGMRELKAALSAPTSSIPVATCALVMDLVDLHRDLTHEMSFQEFVTRQVSQACAAYYDQGQSRWTATRGGLYDFFRRLALDDASPQLLMGAAGLRAAARRLPADARSLIALATDALGVPTESLTEYYNALLLRVLGWASVSAYQGWQAKLAGETDDHLLELLACLLAWEWMLFEHGSTEGADAELASEWARARVQWKAREADAKNAAAIDWVLHHALELSYQEAVIKRLEQPAAQAPRAPKVQAVFCIDVRSEAIRRSLEAEWKDAQTLGYGGFFGLPAEYQPVSGPTRPQLPGLLGPAMTIADVGPEAAQTHAEVGRRADAKALKSELASHGSSMFSLVETLGLGSLVSLTRSALRGNTPTADAARSAALEEHGLRPELTHHSADGSALALPERVALAAGILRSMSLTQGFARLVVFVGHCATTTNNPQAAGLQCGACGGQSGEVNARALANLLNHSEVRQGLANEGIEIPATTHFLAGLHNTTTDEVQLFPRDGLPESHATDLAELRSALARAGEGARAQRLAAGGDHSPSKTSTLDAARARSRDWAEVRPEWGLTRNAAMVIAPRTRTKNVNLDGRAFLHEYDWTLDSQFGVLEQIMTAPMVVAHFINMQYFASTVDNPRYGSGNKVLHNIVGGNLGVFEGAGGDIRIGLPMQSLHDGSAWVHEPLRLSVFIEAPREAIDGVLKRHARVAELVQNEWLFLFCIDPESERVLTRVDGEWSGGTHA